MRLVPDSNALVEYNTCHTPAGPGGGQFCTKAGGGSTARDETPAYGSSKQPRLSKTERTLLQQTDNRLHPGFVTISRYAGRGPEGGRAVGGVRDSNAAGKLVQKGLLVFERRHSNAVGRRGYTIHVSDITFKVTDKGKAWLAAQTDTAKDDTPEYGSSPHAATLRTLVTAMGYLATEGRSAVFSNAHAGPHVKRLPAGVTLAQVKKAIAASPVVDGWRFTYSEPEVVRSKGGVGASKAGIRVDANKRAKYVGAKVKVERA